MLSVTTYDPFIANIHQITDGVFKNFPEVTPPSPTPCCYLREERVCQKGLVSPGATDLRYDTARRPIDTRFEIILLDLYPIFLTR